MRDSQKSRLYKAEREALQSKVAPQFSHCLQAEDWCKSIMREPWFKKRFPYKHRVEVLPMRGGSARGGPIPNGCFMKLSRSALVDWVILHELAHGLQRRPSPGHGWEFCEVYLWLVKNVMGKAAGDALTSAFIKHKIKFHSAQVGTRLSQIILQRKIDVCTKSS